MAAGATLGPGQTLVATGGRYILEMDKDGNLSLTWLGRLIWATNTMGHDGARVSLGGVRELFDSAFTLHGCRRDDAAGRLSLARPSTE